MKNWKERGLRMGYFFDDKQSIYSMVGSDAKQVLRSISNRYVAQQPQYPLRYKAYCKSGILRNKDYRYEVDFNKVYPNAKYEQYVYAWAKAYAGGDNSLRIDVNCFGPIQIYCNGEMIFKSNIFQERYPENKTVVMLPLKKGSNHIVMSFKKTRAGFGGIFGGWLGKFNLCFDMPSIERDGQEGWIFTEPMDAGLPILPIEDMSEKDTGVKWFPNLEWDEKNSKLGQMQRIFGLKSGCYAIAWTKADFNKTAKYRIKGHSEGGIIINVGCREVFNSAVGGAFDFEFNATFGNQDIFVKSYCGNDDWGFKLEIYSGDKKVETESPCNIFGTSEKWIYAGVMDSTININLDKICDLYNLINCVDGQTYWRIDALDTWVRPYNYSGLYGAWNYPLGVTVYGLLHSAIELESEDIKQYIKGHINQSCKSFEYALWDKEQYGGATSIHNLLTSIDSLDDCGSFGSVVLEAAKYLEVENYKPISDYIADYISNKQIRLEDGTFFRKNLMHEFHEDTLWADDLYMSVPFLCRYYQLTGDEIYIDDAASQFLGFKKRLYMPEYKIMSHVYDFKHGSATNVPWGRGNGWVAFSLTELLEVLPENHAKRAELLAMFNDLCEGYLALQDEQGMWHQVLFDHDSYPETSCTSMFIYAFSRGLRFGWLKDGKYAHAVLKAFKAITKVSVDKQGNVHGVCKGSEFSFTPDYYKYDLLWNLNDTHGIGIVLLAGVEVLRLMQFMKASDFNE